MHQNFLRLGALFLDTNPDLPPLAREICRELQDQIVQLAGRIRAMKTRIGVTARERETSCRLWTMPGVGPIHALAVATIAPSLNHSNAVATGSRTMARGGRHLRRGAELGDLQIPFAQAHE